MWRTALLALVVLGIAVVAAADGKQIYLKGKCADCHCLNGAGNPKRILDGHLAVAVNYPNPASTLQRWMESHGPKPAKVKIPFALGSDDYAALVEYFRSVLPNFGPLPSGSEPDSMDVWKRLQPTSLSLPDKADPYITVVLKPALLGRNAGPVPICIFEGYCGWSYEVMYQGVSEVDGISRVAEGRWGWLSTPMKPGAMETVEAQLVQRRSSPLPPVTFRTDPAIVVFRAGQLVTWQGSLENVPWTAEDYSMLGRVRDGKTEKIYGLPGGIVGEHPFSAALRSYGNRFLASQAQKTIDVKVVTRNRAGRGWLPFYPFTNQLGYYLRAAFEKAGIRRLAGAGGPADVELDVQLTINGPKTAQAHIALRSTSNSAMLLETDIEASGDQNQPPWPGNRDYVDRLAYYDVGNYWSTHLAWLGRKTLASFESVESMAALAIVRKVEEALAKPAFDTAAAAVTSRTAAVMVTR
jgi:hypothetical protein